MHTHSHPRSLIPAAARHTHIREDSLQSSASAEAHSPAPTIRRLPRASLEILREDFRFHQALPYL